MATNVARSCEVHELNSCNGFGENLSRPRLNVMNESRNYRLVSYNPWFMVNCSDLGQTMVQFMKLIVLFSLNRI